MLSSGRPGSLRRSTPRRRNPIPQYAYAEKKGIPFVLSLNDEDVAAWEGQY
jgi:hypothetical protein